MAITLSEEPLAINPIYNPIVYRFTCTDIGSGDEIRKLAYRLFFNGVALTPWEAVRFPGNNTDLRISVHKDLWEHLTSGIPTGVINGVSNVSTAVGEIYMEYKEVLLNSALCTSEDIGLATSATVKVINAAVQDYEALTLFQTDAPVILSTRPLTLTHCAGALDYIYVYRAGATLIVTYRAYLRDGSVTTVITGPSFDVNAIPMVPYEFAGRTVEEWIADTVKFETDISINGDVTTYTTFFEDCGCSESLYQIAFLEHLGGISYISFPEDIDGLSVGGSAGEVFRFDEYEQNPGRGNQIAVNKRAYDYVTFRYETEYSERAAQWFRTLLSSSSYWLIKNPKRAGEYYRKAYLDSSNSDYWKSGDSAELIISFKVANYINTHQSTV